MEREPAKVPRRDDIDEAELEEFVSKTLKAVINGLAVADKHTRPKGAAVFINEDMEIPLAHQVEFGLPEEVAFDVAVTVARRNGKNGGLKIEVFSVGGQFGGETGNEKSVASRVSFKVPVKWKHNFK